MGMQCCHSWISVHRKEGKCFLFCTCTLMKPLTSPNCSFPSCLVFPLGVWLMEKLVPELCTQNFCVPVQWNLPSAGLTPPFGGEIKHLLHNEPWDCPLPGNEAALVYSSFSSILWVWILRLGARGFSCTCLELTHHRFGFGFSLPDWFSSLTPRFPCSYMPLAMLKQFLWCTSNRSCPVPVFSLPVQLCVALGVLVVVWCCGGGGQAGEAPCPVGVRNSEGEIASSPLSSVERKECKSLRSLG